MKGWTVSYRHLYVKQLFKEIRCTNRSDIIYIIEIDRTCKINIVTLYSVRISKKNTFSSPFVLKIFICMRSLKKKIPLYMIMKESKNFF